LYALAAIAFLALWFFTWRLSPSPLCPSMVFVGTWTLNILGLLLLSGTLYQVSPETLAIFFWGAVWFVAGTTMVHAAGRPVQLRAFELDADARWFAERVLSISLVGCVLVFPIFVKAVITLASTRPGEFLYSIRQASVDAGGSNLGIGWTENFVILSGFTAMGWVYLYDRSRKARWITSIALVTALSYGLLTGTKGGLIHLLLALLFVSWIKHGRLSRRAVLISGSALAVSVAIGFFVFNLAAENIAGARLVGSLIDIVRLYWLGNMVAFDNVVVNPHSVALVHPPERGLMLLANNLGARYDVPPLHALYVPAGPGMVTNTYTIYFSYFTAFGWLGTAAAMWLLGAFNAVAFRRAAAGSALAAMLYSLLAQRLVMSFHSEQFLLGINPFLKAMLFFGLIFIVCWRRPSHPVPPYQPT